MKMHSILCSLLSVSSALAAPTLSYEDHSLAERSPNEAHLVGLYLENRALKCGQMSGRFIRAI